MNATDEANYLSCMICAMLAQCSSSSVAVGALASIHANMFMNIQLTDGCSYEELLEDHTKAVLDMQKEFVQQRDATKQ